MWTTQFAHRHLPSPELPDARYACVDGRLVMTPAEVGTNSYGGRRLSADPPFPIDLAPADLLP
ncbi:hypothetical protein V6U77_01950 [Micromonospora sp. CPCC 205546]|uniref:hypothetical protein n=1 Tax=Micromonospora sp. CPCC 205546 TaxID=3122397 RepID=UPI002FF14288